MQILVLFAEGEMNAMSYSLDMAVGRLEPMETEMEMSPLPSCLAALVVAMVHALLCLGQAPLGNNPRLEGRFEHPLAT